MFFSTLFGGLVLLLVSGSFLYAVFSIAQPKLVRDPQNQYERKKAIAYSLLFAFAFTTLIVMLSLVVDSCYVKYSRL